MISTVLLVSYETDRDTERTDASVDRMILADAGMIADGLTPMIHETGVYLDTLSARAPPVLEGSAACREWLPAGMAFLPEYSNAELLDSSGVTLCSALPGSTDVPGAYGDRSWFHAAIRGRVPAIGPPQAGRHPSTWTQTWARPVRIGGAVRGVVALRLDLVAWQRLVGRPALPPGSVVTVLDADNVVITRYPDPEAWMGRRIPTTRPTRDTADRATNLTWSGTEEGLRARVAFVDLPDAGWRVYVSVPEAAIRAPVRSSRNANLALAGVLGFLVLGGTTLVERRIVGSLDRLLGQVGRAGRDADSEIAIGGTLRELAELGEAFNRTLRLRRQAEDRSARTSLMLEGATDAVLVLDANRCVTYANRSCVELLGYDHAEFLGLSLDELVDDPDLVDTAWRSALDSGSWVGRLPVVPREAREGKGLLLEVALTRIAGPCGAPSFLITGRDVTRQVERADVLRRAEQLEAVGQVASGVAHDFNNVLTAIRSHADLLRRSMTDGAETAHLDGILRGVKMGAALTRQLVAFARAGEGSPEPVRMNALIGRVTGFLRRVLPPDTRLEVELDDAVGTVLLDPAQGEQILLNLALNAHDAMPSGGVIRIATQVGARPPCGPHNPEPAPEGILLTVSDTGAGMDAATLSSLFEPFVTTKQHGTGLGLSIVHDVVTGAGGRILVSSEPGSGTEFRIWLPFAAEAGAAVDEDDLRPHEPGRRVKILLAEDTEVVREVVREALEDYGHDVVVASDAHAALDAARASETPFEVLVSDIVMPGMKGPELYAELLRLFPQLRAILISGASQHAHGWSDAGTRVVFLPKPFGPDELLSSIDAVLEA